MGDNTSPSSAMENVKVKIMDKVEIPILTRCCFCIPLRKGLIAMAYINLVLTGLVLPMFSYFIFTYDEEKTSSENELEEFEYFTLPQLVVEFVTLVLDFIMTLVFIVGLHTKKIILMRAYLYFGILYTLFSAVYNVVLASIHKEAPYEFVMVITQLIIHIYFLILVWSSIVKMSRDGTVKYTRNQETA